MKALKQIAIVVLLVAAFLIGRGSVKPVTTEPKTTTKRPVRLTALDTRSSSEKSSTLATTNPRENTQNTPYSSPTREAKKATEIIAAIVAEENSYWQVNDLVLKWLEKDPDEAISWLATGEKREQVLVGIFGTWASNGPDAAEAWLTANPNFDGYESASYGLAIGLARTEGAGKALDLLESISDPTSRAEIWAVAGFSLLQSDEDALYRRLSESDLPANLQESMIQDWQKKIARITRDKAKRNAQNLTSVYASALVAGASFESTTPDGIVREIVEGITGGDSFADTMFQVPNMSPEEIENALRHIGSDTGGSLTYSPSEEDAE